MKAVVLILCCIPILFCSASECNAEKVKTIEKRIAVRPDQKATLSTFSNADINIRSWDKPEMSILLTIKITSSEEEMESRYIDSIYIVERSNSHEAIFQLVDKAPQNEDKSVKIFGWEFGDSFHKEIKCEIFVPAYSPLQAGLAVCRANIENIEKYLHIAGQYNSLSLKNCSNIHSIRNSGGSISLNNCGGELTIDAKSSKTIVNSFSGSLTFTGDFSGFDAQTVGGSVSILSKSATITAKDISGNVNIESPFSRIKIVNAKKNIDIVSKSAAIECNTARNIRIESEYSTINLRQISGDSAAADIRSKSSTIRLDDVSGAISVESPYSTISMRNVTGSLLAMAKSSSVTGIKLTGDIQISGDNAGIELREVRTKSLRIDNNGGAVNVAFSGSPEKILALNPNGNTTISIPQNYDGELHFYSTNGIDTNLPLFDRSNGLPKRYDGKLGQGNASITIRSANIKFFEL